MPIGGNFAGGDQALQTLELLANPKRLAEKLNELRSAQEGAQAVIDLAGPASEILKLRQEAAQDRAEAAKALEAANLEKDSARASAAATLDQARSEAEKLILMAQSEAQTVQKAAEEQLKAANDLKAAAEDELKAAQEKQQVLTAELGRLKAIDASLNSELEVVRAQKKQLADAQDTLRKAIGE